MSLANLLMSAPPYDEVLPVVGAAWQGGFYYGRIIIGGAHYALVLSPRATGNLVGYAMQEDTVYTFTGNTSTNDGKLIQDNMVAHGIAKFPAQQAVMALTINGCTDWYIPSKDEMEILYRALKPHTTQNVTTSGANPSAYPAPTSNYLAANPTRTSLVDFRSTGGTNYLSQDYYYTATQGPSGPEWAHAKRFTTGADSQDNIWWDYEVRAIRRVLIPT